jgi:hypothetical protein
MTLQQINDLLTPSPGEDHVTLPAESAQHVVWWISLLQLRVIDIYAERAQLIQQLERHQMVPSIRFSVN